MPTAPKITDSYTQERWNIFETFTLPSVIRQIKRPNKWIIYFDEDRSAPIRPQIDALAADHDFISPCFVLSGNDVLSDLQARHRAEDDVFITSRLDNDDLLHPSFISDVQDAADMQIADSCIVDFPLSYSYRFGSVKLYKTERNIITPFASLIERGTNEVAPKTILVDEHTRLRHAIGLVRYLYTPRTMATLHETNVINGNERWRLRDLILRRAKKNHLSISETQAILTDFGVLPRFVLNDHAFIGERDEAAL